MNFPFTCFLICVSCYSLEAVYEKYNSFQSCFLFHGISCYRTGLPETRCVSRADNAKHSFTPKQELYSTRRQKGRPVQFRPDVLFSASGLKSGPSLLTITYSFFSLPTSPIPAAVAFTGSLMPCRDHLLLHCPHHSDR